MYKRQVIANSSKPIDHELHLPHHFHPDSFESDGYVQPYSDTPLDGEIVGENVYLNIINRARKYVYILSLIHILQITGEVNSAVPGTYKCTYYVID